MLAFSKHFFMQWIWKVLLLILRSIYRLVIKYCVFPVIFEIFLNSASFAPELVFYLSGVCTHTDTEGKQRKARDRNILKSSKKTQYLMNTLYLSPGLPGSFCLSCHRSLQLNWQPHILTGKLPTLLAVCMVVKWFILRFGSYLFCQETYF